MAEDNNENKEKKGFKDHLEDVGIEILINIKGKIVLVVTALSITAMTLGYNWINAKMGIDANQQVLQQLQTIPGIDDSKNNTPAQKIEEEKTFKIKRYNYVLGYKKWAKDKQFYGQFYDPTSYTGLTDWVYNETTHQISPAGKPELCLEHQESKNHWVTLNECKMGYAPQIFNKDKDIIFEHPTLGKMAIGYGSNDADLWAKFIAVNPPKTKETNNKATNNLTSSVNNDFTKMNLRTNNGRNLIMMSQGNISWAMYSADSISTVTGKPLTGDWFFNKKNKLISRTTAQKNCLRLDGWNGKYFFAYVAACNPNDGAQIFNGIENGEPVFKDSTRGKLKLYYDPNTYNAMFGK
jgi:hypothetical protein